MKWHLRLLPNKESEQANQELKILEEDVALARNFLRKNRKTYFQGKNKVPIYLILGPSRFGKTTILSQAGLELIDVNKQPFKGVTPTKYCSFWFTKDAIYIDTAGNYTKPDITKPRNDLIWRGFIKLLQKYFGKDSISSVLVILDLPALSEDKSLLKRTLFCIRERIYELATLIKNVHVHIMFTKCDRISGFVEFFSLLDTEERREPFGISFPSDKKIDLITSFEEKFNILLKNLNNRIVENLQRSVQPENRPLIKLFPSQLEQLRQTFIEIIGKIPNSSQIILSGLYFTSSIQNGIPINPIKNTLSHIFRLGENDTYSLEAHDNRSFFIEKVFKDKIQPQPQTKKRKKIRFNLQFHIEYVYALIIIALVVMAISFIGYKSYQKNINAIDQTKKVLQNQNTYDHNSLYKIIGEMEQDSKSLWLTLGINKIKSLYNSLTKAHQILFIQNLATQLENNLETTLESQDPNKTRELYQNLQIYLMFRKPEKLNPIYVKAWFSNYWGKIYDNKEKENLQKQLDTTLQYKFKTELNKQLIDTVRDYLKNLPQPQLTYLLLENKENKFTDQTINIDDKNSIPKMYTKENFREIYQDSIPNLIKNLPNKNWVIGKLKLEIDNNTIINDLRDTYIKKYISAWKYPIELKKEKEPKSTKEAIKYLKAISSNKSPLIKSLEQIKNNIDIKNPPEKLTEEINEKLNNLNNINIIQLQKNLEELSDYITSINRKSDPNKGSLTAIINYLENESEDNPITKLKTFAEEKPLWLKTYLQSIITNVVQVLLNASQNHINQTWNKEIVLKYNETLANKYPLFKDSKEDVSLNDFSKFFGPNGTMDNFFKKNIEPLVNTEKTTWEWKKIDGYQIDFSPNFLEIFLRASMIKEMFFASKTLKPKIRFSLTPIAMTPKTQSFSLHIDGQKITFANDNNKKTSKLVWPGPQPGTVTISFVNAQGKYFTTSELGTWAWFRILDKINITANNNTKRFQLAFNLNGNTAKYTLSTSEPVNPFIPDVINNFRCIEQPNKK